MSQWDIMSMAGDKTAVIGTLEWNPVVWSFSTTSKPIEAILETIRDEGSIQKMVSIVEESGIQDVMDSIDSSQEGFVEALSDYLMDKTLTWLEKRE